MTLDNFNSTAEACLNVEFFARKSVRGEVAPLVFRGANMALRSLVFRRLRLHLLDCFDAERG